MDQVHNAPGMLFGKELKTHSIPLLSIKVPNRFGRLRLPHGWGLAAFPFSLALLVLAI